MKQRDHDRSLLFPISEDSYTYHRYSPPMRPKITPNQYLGRDLRVEQLSARDKCVQDKRSHIFYEPTKIERQPFKEERPKSPPMDHRQRMLFQNTSHVLPGYSYDQVKQVCESRTRVVENPNEHIKHQNQNFSDMFNRQCGDHKLNTRVRSASPQVDWVAYDSIRNAKDCTSNEYTTVQRQQSPLKPTGMTNLEINVKKQSEGLNSYAKLHGKPVNQQKIVYQGMLKWKNQYK